MLSCDHTHTHTMSLHHRHHHHYWGYLCSRVSFFWINENDFILYDNHHFSFHHFSTCQSQQPLFDFGRSPFSSLVFSHLHIHHTHTQAYFIWNTTFFFLIIPIWCSFRCSVNFRIIRPLCSACIQKAYHSSSSSSSFNAV